jgi:hypothetical protein
MLSELHSLNLKLCNKQYNKKFVLPPIVVLQLSSGRRHNYSTKTRLAGRANKQSMYSLMSMIQPFFCCFSLLNTRSERSMTAYIVHSLPLLMSAVQVMITVRFYSATLGTAIRRYSYPWVSIFLVLLHLVADTHGWSHLWVMLTQGACFVLPLSVPTLGCCDLWLLASMSALAPLGEAMFGCFLRRVPLTTMLSS